MPRRRSQVGSCAVSDDTPIEIKHLGKRYFWTGKTDFYDERHLQPNKRIRRQLLQRLAEALNPSWLAPEPESAIDAAIEESEDGEQAATTESTTPCLSRSRSLSDHPSGWPRVECSDCSEPLILVKTRYGWRAFDQLEPFVRHCCRLDALDRAVSLNSPEGVAMIQAQRKARGQR